MLFARDSCGICLTVFLGARRLAENPRGMIFVVLRGGSVVISDWPARPARLLTGNGHQFWAGSDLDGATYNAGVKNAS